MERESLKFDAQEAREIIANDHTDFKVVQSTLLSHSRWSLHYETIVQRFSDGKYFSTCYQVGATEQQDERPYEYETPHFKEVFPTEKTVTVYE